MNVNIKHKIQIANIGELERQEKQNIALRRALYNGNKAIDVENYHTYEEVTYLPSLLDLQFSSSYRIITFCIGDGLLGWFS